jgi:NarL family two-component system response regulator LiaR
VVVRVLICDDQVVVCDGLELILNTDPEIEVVGLAFDGSEAVEMIPAAQPDLVLMDLKMPIMNGIHATREIKRRNPEIKILVLTTFGEDEWVFDAVRSGADGYLLKGTPRDKLVSAIKGTVAGEVHIDPQVGGKLLAQVAQYPAQQDTTMTDKLSDREVEVLKLLSQGLTNAEIAERLSLTRGTVRNYVSSILNKLDVDDRTQAAILAIRHGLVSAEDL